MNTHGSGSVREPTSDELLAMAYADGELDQATRAAFEARLAREPALAREVAAQTRLNVLARQVAPLEPEDVEWARLDRSSGRQFGLSFAWLAVALGIGGAAAFGLWSLLDSRAPLFLKIALSLVVAGFIVWFALVARARARTRVYDPYTEIKR